MDGRGCVYCGSGELFIKSDSLELHEPFLGVRQVAIEAPTCRTCGFEEYLPSKDQTIERALSDLKKASMVHLLNDLNSSGLTNAYMERALGLPARTLARWKNEASLMPSAAGHALMRLIWTFPWLLQVAEAGFDEQKAQILLLKAAGKEEEGRCEPLVL